jgi:hypothetical protein
MIIICVNLNFNFTIYCNMDTLRMLLCLLMLCFEKVIEIKIILNNIILNYIHISYPLLFNYISQANLPMNLKVGDR